MRKKIVITVLVLALAAAAALTLQQGQMPTRTANIQPRPAHQHAPAQPHATVDAERVPAHYEKAPAAGSIPSGRHHPRLAARVIGATPHFSLS